MTYKRRKIFCVECNKDVNAELVTGKHIYPHREDLYELPFWRCDVCKNYVGCHHKTVKRTEPLGVIPNKELRDIRYKIHQILDPIWKSRRVSRKKVYQHISRAIGKEYHTGEIRSVEEAEKIIKLLENY